MNIIYKLHKQYLFLTVTHTQKQGVTSNNILGGATYKYRIIICNALRKSTKLCLCIIRRQYKPWLDCEFLVRREQCWLICHKFGGLRLPNPSYLTCVYNTWLISFVPVMWTFSGETFSIHAITGPPFILKHIFVPS